MAEQAVSQKGKFFGAVACLEPVLTEFSYPLDQHLQVGRHLRILPFILQQ
jgi:hypothetical protein